jgi:hypothetical protein
MEVFHTSSFSPLSWLDAAASMPLTVKSAVRRRRGRRVSRGEKVTPGDFFSGLPFPSRSPRSFSSIRNRAETRKKRNSAAQSLQHGFREQRRARQALCQRQFEIGIFFEHRTPSPRNSRPSEVDLALVYNPPGEEHLIAEPVLEEQGIGRRTVPNALVQSNA